MMRSAMIFSLSLSSRPSTKAIAAFIDISPISAMFFPPTVTARASLRSLSPPQVGQHISDMHSSISARIAGLCVS